MIAIDVSGMTNSGRPNALAFIQYYLPGSKAGGPIRSVANLVATLGSEVRFRIVTTDRDLGDSSPYPAIASRRWQKVEQAEVYYAPPGYPDLRELKRLLLAERPDVVYAISLFAAGTRRLIALRALGVAPYRRLVIAPSGELKPGALKLKTTKKRLMLSALRYSKVLAKVTWQASSEQEAAEIREHFATLRRDVPGGATEEPHIIVAPNLATLNVDPNPSAKQPGSLRLAYVGRIARNKNLLGALHILRRVGGPVDLNVFGNSEDIEYRRDCDQAIAQLPSSVTVRMNGAVGHDTIPSVFASHDFLFLPTWGENFGHAIIEALGCGCPVVISDRTPWRNLEQLGVGWDISLDDTERFVAVLQRCREMPAAEHSAMRERAAAFAANLRADRTLANHRALFATSN